MHRAILDRRAAIADLCRRRGIRRLEVFGSAAKSDQFDPDRSDVDLLADFFTAPTLAEFFSTRDELAAVLGRPVDLVTEGAIRNPYVTQEIDRAREVLYAA